MADADQTDLHAVVQRMIDAGESEENIATVIRHYSQQAAPVDRGGLSHPLTSVVAPELEQLRGAVDAAVPLTHGTPIMARSRTGALYPSETGPGSVGGFVKNLGNAAAGAAIDQAEGMTSPVGLATEVIGGIGPARIARGMLRTVAGAGDVVDPAIIGTVSPRGANVVRAAQRMRNAMDEAAMPEPAASAPRPPLGTARGPEWWQQRTAPAPEATPSGEPSPQGGSLTPEQRADLVRQHYPPDVIQKIEGQLRMAPSHEPTAPTPPPSEPPQGPMQQERNAIGADKGARKYGITPTEMRQVAGSRFGETVGTPSPVAPDEPFDRVFETLKGLPKEGPERLAYVKAANSEKMRTQLATSLRILQRLGLVAPFAVGASEFTGPQREP